MSVLKLLPLAFVVVTPTVAQGQSASQSVDSPDAKVICRREKPTGSIMFGKKVCHTKAEWTAIDNQRNSDARQNESRSMQNNGFLTGNRDKP